MDATYIHAHLDEQSNGAQQLDEECRWGKNATRDVVHKNKQHSSVVQTSLQTCSLEYNLTVLEQAEKVLNDNKRKEKIKGLQAVLQELLHMHTPGVCVSKFALTLDEAFEIYMGFQSINIPKDSQTLCVKKQEFIDSLLHPKIGLCISIVHLTDIEPFIIPRVEKTDMTGIFQYINSQLGKTVQYWIKMFYNQL